MTKLDMQVRLYTSAEELADGVPEWTGTLEGFWQVNQDSYNWREIRDIGDDLEFTGRHHGGGGAGGEFWLLRGDAGTPRGPDDPLAKLYQDKLGLVTALRELAVWTRDELGDRLEVEPLAAARRILAAHGARV
jgi:hypothetical protein